MHLDLSELSQLAPIFRELFKGYHVSRRDPELYAQLSNFQDQYRTLFKALGFELVCDTRGFYYFVPDSAIASAQVNKTAQRLALFTFIIVEHLADQGRDPIAVLDGGSLGRDELPSLLEKYRDLFIQAEVQTVEELEEKIMRRMIFSSSSSWLATSAWTNRSLYLSSRPGSSSRPRLPPSSTAIGSRPWSARCSTRMKVNSERRWAVLFTCAAACSGTK